jgi:hypothetical protein
MFGFAAIDLVGESLRGSTFCGPRRRFGVAICPAGSFRGAAFWDSSNVRVARRFTHPHAATRLVRMQCFWRGLCIMSMAITHRKLDVQIDTQSALDGTDKSRSERRTGHVESGLRSAARRKIGTTVCKCGARSSLIGKDNSAARRGASTHVSSATFDRADEKRQSSGFGSVELFDGRTGAKRQGHSPVSC